MCGLTNNHIESLMIALSGGEAAKVRLCKIMMEECNVLILDEPTNHLDILAKEALQEAFQHRAFFRLLPSSSDTRRYPFGYPPFHRR